MISNVPGPPYALHPGGAAWWCRWASARCATIWACFIVSNSESMLTVVLRLRQDYAGRGLYQRCLGRIHGIVCQPGARLKIALHNSRQHLQQHGLRYQRGSTRLHTRDTVVIEALKTRCRKLISKIPPEKASPSPRQALAPGDFPLSTGSGDILG